MTMWYMEISLVLAYPWIVEPERAWKWAVTFAALSDPSAFVYSSLHYFNPWEAGATQAGL